MKFIHKHYKNSIVIDKLRQYQFRIRSTKLSMSVSDFQFALSKFKFRFKGFNEHLVLIWHPVSLSGLSSDDSDQLTMLVLVLKILGLLALPLVARFRKHPSPVRLQKVPFSFNISGFTDTAPIFGVFDCRYPGEGGGGHFHIEGVGDVPLARVRFCDHRD